MIRIRMSRKIIERRKMMRKRIVYKKKNQNNTYNIYIIKRWRRRTRM